MSPALEGARFDSARNLEKNTDLLTAMMDPAFYPKPAAVTHQETHISHIFLVGELVYKIKKAVRYSFLDYSTIAKRRHFLYEEIRLNGRLAPSVYVAVVPITKADSRWQLGGDGPVVEYALIMRRLPEKRMLPFLLETHQMTPDMMGELARVLARFHSEAKRIIPPDVCCYLDLVKKQWNENLADVESEGGRAIDNEMVAALKTFGEQFIDERHDLLIGRARQGWIRDVHGDLHCENICFAPDGIQVFDCIEFSADLRHCDLASEIGFLLMDLEVRGAGHLVEPFLTQYCALMNDSDLAKLLPLYKSYRAIVRGKVQALRGNQAAAARYFRFATRYSENALKPFLVIVCGLTGSGKSTLARELGERFGLPVINSDVVRKRLSGQHGSQTVPFNRGIYSETMTRKTYAAMTSEAERQVAQGTGAILDATFLTGHQREQIIGLAKKQRVPLFVIHCVLSKETTKKRLAERRLAATDISDGRWEIYLEQAAIEQPLSEFAADTVLEVHTDVPLEESAGAGETFLRSQIEKAFNGANG